MTRAEMQAAKRRQKRKQEIQHVGAWTLLVLMGLAAAAIPTAAVAAVLITLAYAQRGYMAMGGEWLAIAAVFCLAYWKAHNKICDRIFEEG